MRKKARPKRQVAALPYRQVAGRTEILLLTSRGTARAIIPKGWPMPGKSNRKAAAIEAREEAGVVGQVSKRSVGMFTYWKRKADHFCLIEVEVFPLRVERLLSDFKEKGQRRSMWVSLEDAAALVDEPELVSLMESLGSRVDFGCSKV